MKKVIYILVSFLILSCSNSKKSSVEILEQNKTSENQIEKNIEKRFLYVFNIDSLGTEMDYELTIEKNDSLFIYHYQNLTDQDKDIDLKFIRKTKRLFFAETEFELTKKNHYSDNNISELSFDLYVMTELVDDGNGPLFFNPKYGVLNLDNGWEEQILFLKKEKESEFAKELIKLLHKKTLYSNVYD